MARLRQCTYRVRRSFERTRKNVHANLEIPLISKILEKYFTEVFYSYFIETSFAVHL